MTKQTYNIPCILTISHNPADWPEDEEFSVDSVKIGGVEFLEFLGVEADDEIYRLLKGLGDE